jgi:hypothetical protein
MTRREYLGHRYAQPGTLAVFAFRSIRFAPGMNHDEVKPARSYERAGELCAVLCLVFCLMSTRDIQLYSRNYTKKNHELLFVLCVPVRRLVCASLRDLRVLRGRTSARRSRRGAASSRLTVSYRVSRARIERRDDQHPRCGTDI